MHSFIQFRILLSAIHFSNSIMPISILLFSFQFYYSLSNYVLANFIVYSADSALGTSKEFSHDIANRGSLGRRRFTESITSMHKCNSTAT